ncbi:MAG TPA: DUF115 domain-containing protein [Spirochaetota bacterium]|nr:DUF115 domain-containing protein [Spirochaetota bacterium]
MISEKITYEVIPAGHGLETIMVKSGGREMPLHSKVNPERDSDLLRERLDPSRYDFLVILGVGLGYHCLPLKDILHSYSRVILVDILDGIDKAMARNRLTSFLIDDPGVTLVAGKTAAEVERTVAELLDMDAVRGISVLEHPASVRIFNDYYSAVKRSIDKVISIKAGNKATRQAFGARYLRNALFNLAMMKNTRPVRHLFNAFREYPAVIIGSGPSLNGDADMIGMNQDRLFIIAVDSALPTLMGRGIRPDMVISIDPQPYVQEHFQGCDCGTVLAVHSITSYHSLVEKLGGFLSFNSHPFSQLAAEIYGDRVGSVDSGTGTVAGDAVSLAVKCGFSRIGMTGLDFSFSDFAIYARGTAYQKRYGTFFQDRFSTVETLNLKYILDSSGGIREGKKFTRKSFIHYNQSLGDFIRINGLTQLVALNDRGIGLEGVTPMPMNDFLKRFCPERIGKKEITGAVRDASRKIDAAPLIEAVSRIVNNAIFDDLLEASLGKRVDAGARKRYEAIALGYGR